MEKYNRQMLFEVMGQNGIYINDFEDIHEVLQIDSITFVTTIIDIEQAFSISFDDNDYEKVAEKDEITVALLEDIIKVKICQ